MILYFSLFIPLEHFSEFTNFVVHFVLLLVLIGAYIERTSNRRRSKSSRASSSESSPPLLRRYNSLILFMYSTFSIK